MNNKKLLFSSIGTIERIVDDRTFVVLYENDKLENRKFLLFKTKEFPNSIKSGDEFIYHQYDKGYSEIKMIETKILTIEESRKEIEELLKDIPGEI